MASIEHNERIILGYDARKNRMVEDPEWDVSRRERYLISKDVRRPLSVDTMVWRPAYSSRPDFLKTWNGFYPDLWSHLDELTSRLSAFDFRERDGFCVVAISLETSGLSSEERERWDKQLIGISPDGTHGCFRGADPSSIQNGWKLLGYDVADAWATSGLSNCGYSGEERIGEAQKLFGMFVNDFHLFDEIDRAREFVLYTNKRVREHAPFYVYGMWEVSCFCPVTQ